MEWAQSNVTASNRSAGSYAVCCGRMYCAFTDRSGHVALAVMAADRSWSTPTQGGPATAGVAPSAVGINLSLLVVFGSPDGSDELKWATFRPTAVPPAWSPAQPMPGLRSAYPVGLVEHAGDSWCAVADLTSGAVSVVSRAKGSWRAEQPIAVQASAAPALVDDDGTLHCMIPTGQAGGGSVVDVVYDDTTRTWSKAAQQPGITASGGVAACVVNGVRYVAFAGDTGQLAVTRHENGQWQEPEDVAAPSLARPAIAQFANHLFVAGQDRTTAAISSTDRVAVSLDDWMSGVSDDRTLGALSMPGTHDSCALYGGPIAQTQTMSITDQFVAGVRWFDIRLAIHDGALESYHGIIAERLAFTDILQALAGCVEKQSSEAVFVSVKHESGHDDQEAFAQLAGSALSGFGARLEWVGVHQAVQMPRLGDLRGRIVVLARSGLGPATGLNLTSWPADNATVASIRPNNGAFAVAVEDHWNLHTIADLDQKWTAVESALTAVPDDPDSWHITFTSASSSYGLLWPIVAARGLWPDEGAGINNRLAAWLKKSPADKSTGTVVLDFPGSPQMLLCPQIISRNTAQ